MNNMDQIKALFWSFPEVLSKTKISQQTAGVPAEIQTEGYPNTNLEYYHYAKKFHLHFTIKRCTYIDGVGNTKYCLNMKLSSNLIFYWHFTVYEHLIVSGYFENETQPDPTVDFSTGTHLINHSMLQSSYKHT